MIQILVYLYWKRQNPRPRDGVRTSPSLSNIFVMFWNTWLLLHQTFKNGKYRFRVPPFLPLGQNLHCSILSHSSFNYFNVIDKAAPDPDKKPFYTYMVDVMILFKENCKEKWRGLSLPAKFSQPYLLTLRVWCCFFSSHKLFPNQTFVASSIYLLASSVSQWLSWMAWAFVLIGGGHNWFSSEAK